MLSVCNIIILRLQQFPLQVERTVKTDAFVVYPVTSESLAVSRNSWKNNTRLVILETKLEKNLLGSVQAYLDGGGKVWDLSDNDGLNHEENYVSSTVETVMNVGEMGSVLEDRFNIDINKSGEAETEETSKMPCNLYHAQTPSRTTLSPTSCHEEPR